MVSIKDGSTGNTAQVDTDKRLHVSAVAKGPLEDESDKGNAAFFHTTFATGGTDIEIMSIQNTESVDQLRITRIIFAAAAACTFTVIEVTSGTPAGTTLTYLNPNLDSGIIKSVTAFGNAAVTGTVVGDTVFQTLVPASTSISQFLEAAIILKNQDTLAISASASTTVHVTVIGFWETPTQ